MDDSFVTVLKLNMLRDNPGAVKKVRGRFVFGLWGPLPIRFVVSVVVVFWLLLSHSFVFVWPSKATPLGPIQSVSARFVLAGPTILLVGGHSMPPHEDIVCIRSERA